MAVKSSADYQKAVLNALKTAAPNGERPQVVMLHGFEFQPLLSVANVEHEAAPPATPTRPPTVGDLPHGIIEQLSQAVRSSIDRETARVIAEIYFATGSSELQQPAFDELDRVAAEYRALPSSKIVIWAHADRRGSTESKARLSRDRALATARDLQRHGVPVEFAQGLSDALEVDRTNTLEGHSLNRRATVLLVPPMMENASSSSSSKIEVVSQEHAAE